MTFNKAGKENPCLRKKKVSSGTDTDDLIIREGL